MYNTDTTFAKEMEEIIKELEKKNEICKKILEDIRKINSTSNS